ncbi:MAG: VPLPA-CTERM sorting domain-containing protein [Roseinatronobacter sp.]
MFNKFSTPLSAVALAATVLLAPISASALSTINLEITNGASSNFETVQTNQPGNATALAGPFLMREAGTTNPTFLAWCFELDKTLVTPTEYTIGGSFLDGNQLSRVQRLFDANYDNAAITTNQVAGAAFQLAIWEVILDDDFSLASGTFSSTTGGTLRTLADDFLTAAAGYSGPQQWVITEYTAPGSQNLGVINAIPLPAAAWLLLTATGGLIIAKRRRQRENA